VSTVGLLIGAASGGFLLWNWPPARIFMDDMGRRLPGLRDRRPGTGCCARECRRTADVADARCGAFFVDATVTLVRRIGRGDRVYEARRSHAYQWLARRWKSHKKVTVSVTAMNLLRLLPCCCFAVFNPRLAPWTTLIALTPAAIAAIAAGAGRREMS
jgi:Fuc2NAc and GlcNAc transferase